MYLEDKVRYIISRDFCIDMDKMRDDFSLQEDLGADSLDAVELIITLEDEFEIEIPDEDAENLVTIEDIIEYVRNAVLNKEKEGK